jgi:hypothetical protein
VREGRSSQILWNWTGPSTQGASTLVKKDDRLEGPSIGAVPLLVPPIQPEINGICFPPVQLKWEARAAARIKSSLQPFLELHTRRSRRLRSWGARSFGEGAAVPRRHTAREAKFSVDRASENLEDGLTEDSRGENGGRCQEKPCWTEEYQEPLDYHRQAKTHPRSVKRLRPLVSASGDDMREGAHGSHCHGRLLQTSQVQLASPLGL